MSFKYLDYDEAHAYVDNQQSRGRTVYWEGWDILSFRPNRAGFTRKDGAFVNGKWGTMRRIKPNKYGKWRISEPTGRTGNRS